MNIKYQTGSDETYTDIENSTYNSAKTENAPKYEKTWYQSGKGRLVPTSHTTGTIKLRISPREMPEMSTTALDLSKLSGK